MLRVRVPRITGAASNAYTLVADGGTYTYSGNNANIIYSRVLQADGGVYSYTGNNANLLFNRILVANGGVYSYSGNNANLTYSGAAIVCPCPPTANEIAQAVWGYLLEGSVSAGQMLTGVTRTQLARVDINETTGQVTIYKLDGTTVFAQASTSPTGDRNTPTVDWT